MLARTDGTGVPTATVATAGRRRRRLWIAGAAVTVAVAAAVYFWMSLFIACGCAEAEEMSKEQEAAIMEIVRDQQSANRLFYAGRYAEAEAAYRAIVAKTEAAFPGEGLMRASAIYNLAAALAEMGRLAEAETLAREALALREAQPERAGSTGLGSARALLGSILRDLGRRSEGNRLMRDAFVIVASDPQGERDLLVRNATRLLGVLAEDGQGAEADKLAGDLLGIVSGLPDDLKIEVWWAVARQRSDAGRFADAERFYREAHALLVGVFPDDLTRRAILVANTASVLRRQYRPVEAEALFRRAVADLEALYPEGHPALATALDGLALTLLDQGRHGEAWPAARRALDLRTALLPADHPLLATSLVNLGLALLAAGQPSVARDALQVAVNRRQSAGDEVGAARAAVSLAIAQATLGDAPGGIASLDNARSVFDESLPGGHPLRTAAAIDQAWLLLGSGEALKALALARQAAAQLFASGRVTSDEREAVPPEEDRRRIVVAVAAAWDVAEGMRK